MASTKQVLAILALSTLTLAQFGGDGGGSFIGNGGSGSSGNPFSTSPSTSSSNNNNAGFGTFGNAGNSDGSFSGFNGNNNGFGFFSNISNRAILLTHGALASLAFVIFFPFGAISIRVFGRAAFVIHVISQILAFLLYIVAFGMGVWLTHRLSFGSFDFWTNEQVNFHPIIGTVIFVLLFLQPITGSIHHHMFKRGRTTRGVSSYAHLWLGRVLITLGIINGGLGLWIARNTDVRIYTAYGVVAGLIWIIWMLVAVSADIKKNRNVSRADATAGSTSRGGVLRRRKGGNKEWVEEDEEGSRAATPVRMSGGRAAKNGATYA